MKITYGEYDDEGRFLSPDELFPSPALMQFILEHGQEGLDELPDGDEQVQALIEQMVKAGMLEREEGTGRLRPTARLVQGMEHRALLEIFRGMKAGLGDGHASTDPGRAGERTDGTKPYSYGDPLGELALHETLRNALARQGIAPREAGRAGARGPLIRLREPDIELHNVESSAETALCVLLDLSGSMMRYGRHIAAKRVAMGLAALVGRRFPRDTVDFVGFASVARPLAHRDVPLAMPRPITTRQWEIRVRVPLDQASRTHPHFTNLQHGLRVARSVLARRGAANKIAFIITDGQPTAHLSGGAAAPILNLIYPPAQASSDATLAEALRCRQEGIRLCSFALIEEYWGMDWVSFVEQMTRLTRGVAYYCTAGDLAETVMESYLSGKKTRAAGR